MGRRRRRRKPTTDSTERAHTTDSHNGFKFEES